MKIYVFTNASDRELDQALIDASNKTRNAFKK
jgi:hypothetical protein